jgi:hypothetical protein
MAKGVAVKSWRRPSARGAAVLRLSERDIEKQLVDYLRLHGWHVHRLEADLWRSKRASAREEVGTPDFICLRRASWYEEDRSVRAFYLEVKRPGGKLRPSQEFWIGYARARGWCVIVADSLDSLITQMRVTGMGDNNG